jgi:hypothetical protein
MLPPCDLCPEAEVHAAHWDAKTVMGPWAYLCNHCLVLHGVADHRLHTHITTVNHRKAPL